MAMKIPDAGNPFGVGITPQSTQQMGLVATPENEHSPGALAKRLGGAADKLSETALKWQKQQEDTRVQAFANDMKEDLVALESDPEHGYSTLLGKNATERPGGKDLVTEYLDQFDAKVKARTEHMGINERRRAMELADAARASFHNKLNLHLIKQAGAVKQAENQRTFNNALPGVTSDDKEERDTSFAIIRAMTDEMARENGVEPDYSKTLGVAHAMRIEFLVDDGRYDEAAAWLKDHKGEMGAIQYKQTKSLVDRGLETKRTGDYASKIILSGKSDAQMLRDVEKLDSKYRKGVRSIVQQHITTQEAIRRQEVQDLTLDAWNIIVSGEDLPITMRADLEQKAPQKLVAIDRYLNARKNGQKVTTDPGTFNQLWKMAQEESEDFSRVNLIEYSGALSPADMSRFLNMQKGIAREDRRAYMAAVSARIEQERASKNANSIKSAALALWNEELENTKAKSVPEARRKELLNQLFKLEDTYGFWSSDKRQWEIISASQEKPSAAVFSAVHGQDAVAVRNGLEKKGIKPIVWNDKVKTAGQSYINTGKWPANVMKAATRVLSEDLKNDPQNEDLKNPSQDLINFYCATLFSEGKF